MMTAMERSISPYEERGSEASMADSLGIKDAAKESSKGLNYDDKTYLCMGHSASIRTLAWKRILLGLNP